VTDHFVIVGAGLAGAMAAETLRKEGFSGRVVLIGAETHRPYERPGLSKVYLTGVQPREALFVHPASWYAEQDVTLLTGVRVTSVDPAGHTLTTDDGTHVAYTKLLLATGSTPRPLPVPGAGLDGLLYLRTFADAERLVPWLADGVRVVVIGGGWIGLEVAAAARLAGAHVTVIEAAAGPLQRVLGPEVAHIFQTLHEANGVRVITGTSVRQLRGAGRVEAVELADGTELAADVVVAGIGVSPNVDLAVGAGLEVGDGVLTDSSLGTSDPDIFAAGDIANAQHPMLGRPLRVEHWANARDGGAAAAKAMLGQTVVYDRVPYFFTDQYDLGMEYRGHAEPGGYDQVVFRGPTDVADGKTPAFLAFWTRGARVLAAMNVNSWDEGEDLERLVRAGFAGRQVDPDRLADPDVALASLLA
jgi:3-phenylpropionate/trans-cinnamate dioxygenase ferredoxin reductase component